MKSTSKLRVCNLCFLASDLFYKIKGEKNPSPIFKGFRSDIAGRKALIQALETNIEKLTEEIKLKQNALAHHTETSHRYEHPTIYVPKI